MGNCLPVWDLPLEDYLNLPTPEQRRTADASLHTLDSGEDVYLLTPGGREILAGLVAVQPPYTQFPSTLLSALGELGGGLKPGLAPTSWQFQFLNLLWRLRGFAFRRSDLSVLMRAMHQSITRTRHPEWFPEYNEDTDVIQFVNKTGQWGLAHQTFHARVPLNRDAEGPSTTYYTLAGPLVYDRARRKTGDYVQPPEPACDCQPYEPAAPAVHSAQGAASARDLLMEREVVLDYLKRTWINVPVSQWTLEGHRDPTNKDDSPLVAQPQQYNRKMQNTYKFDEYGLPLCPTVDRLLSRFDAFYPSSHERASIFDYLVGRIDDIDLSEEARARLVVWLSRLDDDES